VTDPVDKWQSQDGDTITATDRVSLGDKMDEDMSRRSKEMQPKITCKCSHDLTVTPHDCIWILI